jgi:plastocyanin
MALTEEDQTIGGTPTRRRGRRHLLLVAVAGVLAVCGAAAVLSGRTQATVDRTIELPMKNYVFAGNNPTLKLVAGETVRIVVRNDEPDPRVLHSFRILGLSGASCDTPIQPGEAREFVVHVPRTGEYVYTCCTHPGMGGAIQVVKPETPAPR